MSILIKHIVLTVDIGFDDHVKIWNDFISIINKTGATIVNSNYHVFTSQYIEQPLKTNKNTGEILSSLYTPLHPLSGTILIMESHAAIHTWPEKQIAWVGFFTCGDEVQIEKFRKEIAKKWNIVSTS